MSMNLDEYGPNPFHDLFPPEQLRLMWSHRRWSVVRLIFFVVCPLMVAFLSVLLSVILFNEIRLVSVLVGTLPGVLALLGVLVMAGHFVKSVFGLSSWKQGYRHALLCLFGPPSPLRYPYAVVSEGKIREEDQHKCLAHRELGGPGQVHVFNDSAVVLEQFGEITCVTGPGAVFLERFERIRETIDLRPQVRKVDLDYAKAYTRDGIAVAAEITVHFQIKPGEAQDPEPVKQSGCLRPFSSPSKHPQSSVPEPFPVDLGMLDRVARAQATSIPPGKDNTVYWEDRIMRVVGSRLIGIVARKTFDELFRPSDAGVNPRDEIRREMIKGLQAGAQNWGVEILDVNLGPFKPVDKAVEQQRLESWLTVQQSHSQVKDAGAEVDALRTLESAHAIALREMLVNIGQGFHRLSPGGKREKWSSYFVALRFIEMVRRSADKGSAGAYLQASALQTLDFMDRLLLPPTTLDSELRDEESGDGGRGPA